MEATCLQYFDQQIISPCLTEEHDCDKNSNCEAIDTQGNFRCNCKIGFTKPKNSQFCIALIDECSSGIHNCNENAFCFDKADSSGFLKEIFKNKM